jgi:molybdopterin-guanine dinucleotide biosynthesis protein A
MAICLFTAFTEIYWDFIDMLSCIVIAGGKSKRMGMDKKFIKVKGKAFIEHAVTAAEKIGEEVIIVLGSEKEKKKIRLGNLVVVDEEEGKGPLMGMLTGLKKCKGKYALVLPVDTPLMEPKVLEYIVEQRHGYDAVIPKNGEHIHPLHAVYKVKAMIDACYKTLQEGNMSVHIAAKRLKKIMFIPVDELRKYDKDLLTFKSINTPEDLKRQKLKR